LSQFQGVLECLGDKFVTDSSLHYSLIVRSKKFDPKVAEQVMLDSGLKVLEPYVSAH